MSVAGVREAAVRQTARASQPSGALCMSGFLPGVTIFLFECVVAEVLCSAGRAFHASVCLHLVVTEDVMHGIICVCLMSSDVKGKISRC